MSYAAILASNGSSSNGSPPECIPGVGAHTARCKAIGFSSTSGWPAPGTAAGWSATLGPAKGGESSERNAPYGSYAQDNARRILVSAPGIGIMQTPPFIVYAQAALAATPVSELLSKTEVVILERIARGGGATRWYYCSHLVFLEKVVEQLAPGSVVSFYFDRRINSALYSNELETELRTIVADTGELLMGRLDVDQIHIEMEVLAGFQELADFAARIDPASRVFFGSFPSRDNDGTQSVTLVLPDLDGVVRSHPH